MLLLEISLEGSSHFHSGAHVTLLESGEEGVGVLRLFESLSDLKSHSVHWFSSFSSADDSLDWGQLSSEGGS